MQLPIELQQAIESLAESHKHKSLKTARESVSKDYREGASSRTAFRDSSQLLSYLITRMPATYAACVYVFREIVARLSDFEPKTCLDLGSGPGTASWAALEAFPSIEKLHLVERELDAIEVGKKLAEMSGYSLWKSAEWHASSLENELPPIKADVAVLSYVFVETANLSLIDRLLDSDISVIAVIEPGTPQGFERIRSIRQHVLDKGANLIAPCPHAKKCPMAGGDWCHFGARVERTKLHRLLKEGTLGHEDEKYSYVVFSKDKVADSIRGRLVRPPIKSSGFVRLPLCSQTGELVQETVTRSNKESYRKARDAEWGSAWL
jgi:ribosomal protein RSM22 (predicted rRNA methylase)